MREKPDHLLGNRLFIQKGRPKVSLEQSAEVAKVLLPKWIPKTKAFSHARYIFGCCADLKQDRLGGITRYQMKDEENQQ